MKFLTDAQQVEPAVVVTLDTRDGDINVMARLIHEAPDQATRLLWIGAVRGVEIASVSPERLEQLGLPSDRSGLLVTD